MKKLLSVALIATMLISCFAFTTFAETTYDATLSLKTDSTTYQAGDFLKLTIETDTIFKVQSVRWHFTYNSELLKLVDESKLDETNTDTFDEEYALKFYNKFSSLKSTVNGMANASGDPNTSRKGEYISAFVTPTVGGETIGGSRFSKQPVYTVCFEVNSDIKGTDELNFRWIKNSSDYPIYAKYEVQEGVLEEYNVNFVDTSATVTGNNLAVESSTLPEAYAYSSKNDFEGGKVDINGTEKTITTDYAAAFGTVVPRNGASRVKAGFLLSTESTGLAVDNTTIKNFEAVNFASNNIFGGLFYGPGLEAGKTYYVMPYVTYSDNVTLYAPSAVSFTMPN